MGQYFCGGDVDTNGAIDQLRAALSLFPNLRNISISYRIPSAAENNTYVAIFNELCRRPTICNGLEYLQIEAVKVPEIDPRGCYEQANELYEKLYSKLSAVNQEFLGKKVTNDKVGELLREKLRTQGFPLLKKAKISANCITGVMEDPKSAYMKRSAFYYIPLAFAPQLETLHVETTDSCPIFDTYGFTEKDNSKGRSKSDLDPDVLDVFSRIQDLSLTMYTPPEQKGIQRLVQRFPSLMNLNVRMFNDRACDGYEHNRFPYTAIKKLMNMRNLVLPWPRSKNGSFASSRLQSAITSWRKAGMTSLERVDFFGKRDKTKAYVTFWSDLHIFYYFVGIRSGMGISGDKKKSDYEDKR
ncbi:hypothetical protein TWF730_010147 [Orbilia blumenaviensis]|uniref:Uncharacterized protein n=1 Tax=Orbilia blumenaviensis TaxID=1796055 RepID=A0AAV9UNN7_9PEZI